MQVISISGGRSSAMMLKILLDNGQITPETHVIFANTGREHDATLDFIEACSTRWGVTVTWLEYRHAAPKFEVVTYATASRRFGPDPGRPFRELLEGRSYLPNPVQRICTAEMKIKTIRRYIRSLGHKGAIPTFVGLRYDEPDRVARKKAQNAMGKEAEFCYMPLYDLRITRAERDLFWLAQPFDLAIPSAADNCDFCFLKSFSQQIWRIREEPDAVEWWIEMEENARHSAKRRRHGQFRKEYSFKDLKKFALQQTYIPQPDEPRVSISCACTD